MASPIILILGAGANTGARLAQAFAKNGFKVALASRSITPHNEKSRDLVIKADFTDPTSIKAIFDEVKEKIGTPNVVVYNAAAAKATPQPTSQSVSDFTNSLAINTSSAYAAAKEAISGFETLPPESIKTFIYTGNRLNIAPIPFLLDLGVGKAASAHLIQALSVAYREKGYKFYYGDERNADGTSVGSKISGENHAEYYLELALKKEQGPWNATFVGGKGYVDFAEPRS